MDFKNYSVEDFVLDNRFKKWLLNPQKEDNLFWEEWIAKHPEQLPIIEEAKKIILHLPEENHLLSNAERVDLWSGIMASVESDQKIEIADGKIIPLHSESIIRKAQITNSVPGRNIFTFIFAAVFIFLAGFSFLVTRMDFFNQSESQDSPELIVKSNPWGQKSTVYLSDGTEIVLNSGSTISYTKEFGVDERKVLLQGEAFFKVAKDADKPFRVFSGNLLTEALGTSFNIRSYQAEDNIKVALVSGSVKVTNTSGLNSIDIILAPGEMANYSESNATLAKSTFEEWEICAWKEGVILFENASSEEVFSYLEKWYGVEIKENNEPSKLWNYTGEFNNLDLNNVLKSIGFTMNFEFNKKDKIYYITYLTNNTYE